MNIDIHFDSTFNLVAQWTEYFHKTPLHIHDFLHDSSRFLMVIKIGMDRDES